MANENHVYSHRKFIFSQCQKSEITLKEKKSNSVLISIRPDELLRVSLS